MPETLDFVSLVPWTMIMQWGNLLILFLLMRRFLFKPIKAILAKREDEVRLLYAEAENAKADGQALRTEYEQKLAEAKTEAGAIVQEASQRAQKRYDETVQEAQQRAGELVKKAGEEIELEKKKAVNDMKNEISSIAVDLAGAMVEREVSAKDHEKLIEQFIGRVGEAS